MSSTKNERPYETQKVIDRMGQKLTRQMAGSLTACVHCGIKLQRDRYILGRLLYPQKTSSLFPRILEYALIFYLLYDLHQSLPLSFNPFALNPHRR